MNNITDNGRYYAGSMSNIPANWPNENQPGVAFSFHVSSYYFQIVVTRGRTTEGGTPDGTVFIRKKYSNISWGSWFMFTGEIVS